MYHIFIRILDLKIKVIFFHDHFTIILRKEGGRAFTFPTSEAEKLEINCTQHTCTTHFPTICDVTHTHSLSQTHTHTSIVIISHLHTLSHFCLLLLQMSDNGCFVFLLQVSLYLLCKTLSDSSNVFDSSRLS